MTLPNNTRSGGQLVRWNAPTGDPAMYRNPKLLKAVASLPCQHCGIEGQTQASHANWGSWSGKGMGMKAHDMYTCALCVTCHANIDSGKDLAKWEREEMWLRAWRKTMFELFDRGLVDVRTKKTMEEM